MLVFYVSASLILFEVLRLPLFDIIHLLAFLKPKNIFFTPKLSKPLPVFVIFGAKIQICNRSLMFQTCLFWSPSMMSPNLSRCYALLLISLVSIFP